MTWFDEVVILNARIVEARQKVAALERGKAEYLRKVFRLERGMVILDTVLNEEARIESIDWSSVTSPEAKPWLRVSKRNSKGTGWMASVRPIYSNWKMVYTSPDLKKETT